MGNFSVYAVIAAAGIPSAVFGLLIWWFEHKIEERDKAKEDKEKKREAQALKREKDREEMELNLYESTMASIALGEATARAVQRIPDAHCNGDMHAALEYAEKIKRQQSAFVTRKGISAVVE